MSATLHQLVVVLINTQLNRNDSPNLKQMIRSLELDAFQLRGVEMRTTTS